MGQVRHGGATTTHAIRAAIQRSRASAAALSRTYGINAKTVLKWRKRATVEDLKTGPKTPRSSVLSEEEEATVVAFRSDWAPLTGAMGNEAESIRLGMAATIYHWALHPWAVYGVVALALALFTFNKGLPLTIRSAFYPIFGERVWGWWGHVIDVIAVFATLFGLATSLGFGATQANAGLNELFDVPVGTTTEVVLITVITVVALISVLRGLDGGVKVLSQINMGLAALLALFVFLAGPTLFLISFFWDSLVAYVRHLPALSVPFGREDVNYSQGWTPFYWA